MKCLLPSGIITIQGHQVAPHHASCTLIEFLMFTTVIILQWKTFMVLIKGTLCIVMMSVRRGDSNPFIVWLTIYWYGSKSIGPSVRLHHLAAN